MIEVHNSSGTSAVATTRRHIASQQSGSFLGYSGRPGDEVGTTARDSQIRLSCPPVVAVNSNSLHEVDDARLCFAFLMIRVKRFDEYAPALRRRARACINCSTPGNGGWALEAFAKRWINPAVRLLIIHCHLRSHRTCEIQAGPLFRAS